MDRVDAFVDESFDEVSEAEGLDSVESMLVTKTIGFEQSLASALRTGSELKGSTGLAESLESSSS